MSIIDSHTGGEPTRVILSGGPDLGQGPLTQRVARFKSDCDAFRTAIVTEPRGSDILVGALLVTPTDDACLTGVIFFNNVGYLGMCGHGTIGLIATLAYLGSIEPGQYRIETPVGIVTTVLHQNGQVSVTNVPSYRAHKDVTVNVPGIGPVTGDIAWGGNWFFLTESPALPLALTALDQLTDFAWRVRQAVNTQGYPDVDHVELFGLPATPQANAKNFVLCPGKAYDRSPCGTGTCAKLACLAADGKLAPGTPWIQESITGSQFSATYENQDETMIPTITGSAFVCSESTLVLNENDPLCWGLSH
ncbi:MAG: proline racemase family protein [Phycisphaerae bacterium]|nr:proline racemase family protein [Phycisphaerae bacterium]